MESDAIEKAYRMYAGEAYLYSLSLCGNREMAEDIVSEAFVKALLSQTAKEENFKLWLLKVCKTTWIDTLRRDRFISEKPLDEYIDLQSQEDVFSTLEHKEMRDILAAAMLKLPAPCREAVTLFYYNRIPQAEIAQMLGLTNGAVRTLIYRGRKQLAEELKEAHYEL